MTAQYQHSEFGYNYRMTDISAAIGRVQLNKLDAFREASPRDCKHLQ